MLGFLYSWFVFLIGLWISWTKTETLPNSRIPDTSDGHGLMVLFCLSLHPYTVSLVSPADMPVLRGYISLLKFLSRCLLCVSFRGHEDADALAYKVKGFPNANRLDLWLSLGSVHKGLVIKQKFVWLWKCILDTDTDPNWVGSFGSDCYTWR